MTTADRWHQLRPYVEEMMDLPDEERAAWVAALAARDAPLAADLEALLGEHRALDAERFLDQGPVPLPHRLDAGDAVGSLAKLPEEELLADELPEGDVIDVTPAADLSPHILDDGVADADASDHLDDEDVAPEE